MNKNTRAAHKMGLSNLPVVMRRVGRTNHPTTRTARQSHCRRGEAIDSGLERKWRKRQPWWPQFQAQSLREPVRAITRRVFGRTAD